MHEAFLPIVFRSLLLHFPPMGVFVLVLLFYVLLTVLSFLFFPKLVAAVPEGDFKVRSAVMLVTVIGAFYGMLFGLVNVNLWQNYHKLQDIISTEASDLSNIIINTEVLPEPTRTEMRNAVTNYIQEVRTHEWRMMRDRKSSPDAWKLALSLPKILQTYKPTNSFEQVYYSQTLTKLNDLISTRRARIDAVQSPIPSPILRTLMAGSVFLVLMLCLVIAKVGGGRFLIAMTFVVNILIGLNLYLVFDLDNAFGGYVIVTSDPFTQGKLNELQHPTNNLNEDGLPDTSE